MLRSIASVICGFIVITVLSLGADALLMAIYPEWFTGSGGTKHALPLTFALIYSFCFFIAGGYVTAFVARRAERPHAFALAALLLLMSILSTIQMYETAPLWWHLALLIQIIPAVMIGGHLCAARSRKFYPHKT